MTELEYKIRIAKLESLTTAKELEDYIRKIELPKPDSKKSEFNNIHTALRYMRLTTQAFHMFKEKSVKQLPDFLYAFNSNIKFSSFWLFFEYTEFNKTVPYGVFLDYFKYCNDVLHTDHYKSIRILPLISMYVKDKKFPINVDSIYNIGNIDYFTTALYDNLSQEPKKQYAGKGCSAVSKAIQKIVELEIESALFTEKERILVDKVINGIKASVSQKLLKSATNKTNIEKDIQTRVENIKIFDKNFQRSKKKIYDHLEGFYNESSDI